MDVLTEVQRGQGGKDLAGDRGALIFQSWYLRSHVGSRQVSETNIICGEFSLFKLIKSYTTVLPQLRQHGKGAKRIGHDGYTVLGSNPIPT